jgi:iron(III) transport system substrate-binding protein
MISPDAQEILAKIGYFATHSRAEPPFKNVRLKILDAGTLLDEQESSTARLESILHIKR